MTQPEGSFQPRVFVVRSEYGKYAEVFKQGGYVAIGWLPNVDLTQVKDREELRGVYEVNYPDVVKSSVISNHVGQIARFVFDVRPGDHVLTRTLDAELVYHGVVQENSDYTFFLGSDACPYPHRRSIKWSKNSMRRSDFSVPLQNTMRSLLTIFEVSQANEVFSLAGRDELVSPTAKKALDMYDVVLERILTLDATAFEELVENLLAAMGFEETEHTGKSGDGGVDARGTLDVGGLAKIRLFVQAKRYQISNRISAGVVQAFRGAIPNGAQGAFITTADYTVKAHEVALATGFPRIGLINGRQLVDLLTEHWTDLPLEIRDQLGLQPGLVLV